MKAKTHLLESDVPVAQDSTIIAMCGAEVRNMKAVQVWDAEGDAHSFAFDQLRCCRKCQEAPDHLKRYFYVVVNGQEAMSSEEAQ